MGYSRSDPQVWTNYLNQTVRSKATVAQVYTSRNLDKKCNIYPACYDKRIIMVSRSEIGKKCGYGKRVTILENGTDIKGFGIAMSGTSQATAVVTGKIIKDRAKKGTYEKPRSISSVNCK